MTYNADKKRFEDEEDRQKIRRKIEDLECKKEDWQAKKSL